MRIIIDKKLCNGCGICAAMCSGLFQMKKKKAVAVILEEVSTRYDWAEAVADSCPKHAIIVKS